MISPGNALPNWLKEISPFDSASNLDCSDFIGALRTRDAISLISGQRAIGPWH